jgi:hypothetical protein
MKGVTIELISATSPLGKLWWTRAVEEIAGVGVLARTLAREDVLHRGRRPCRQDHRIEGLVERATDARVVVGEQRTADHGERRAGGEVLLVIAFPDARVVVGDDMVDPIERRTPRERRQRGQEQHHHPTMANVHGRDPRDGLAHLCARGRSISLG